MAAMDQNDRNVIVSSISLSLGPEMYTLLWPFMMTPLNSSGTSMVLLWVLIVSLM